MRNARSDGFTHKAKKSLGQHFLTSEPAIGKMVSAGNVSAGDTVLEIGPGRGALTAKLLEAGARVVAIELDKDVLAPLTARFDSYVYSGQLRIVEADFLTLTDDELDTLVGPTYKIVANIPYYITNAILEKCLTARTQAVSIAVLIQKEVAERIVARDGKQSILSIAIAAYATPRIVSKVVAGSFNPPPNVDSAILALEKPTRDFFIHNPEISEDLFFKIMKAGFAHKRKMVVGNLTSLFPRTSIEQALTKENLPLTIRAEDISLAQWRGIVVSLSN